MRPFDWLSLFRRHRIHFIERGANVKRGEVNIRCPWCGTADPSQHLGVNLESGFYSCWRNKHQHSGKSPVRLICALLRVSVHEAREMAGLGEDYVDPDGFGALAQRLLRPETAPAPQERPSSLSFDREFLEISDRPITRRWWNYLYTRGFDAKDIEDLCERYELRAAREGRMAGRLVLPYVIDGDLVGWTGRAIADAEVRYLDLELERALVPPKRTLFNHDAVLDGGRLLVLVEGPFDALKVDYYGEPFGVRAVAASTNSMNPEQAFMLQDGARAFERVAVMMDNKTDFGLVDSMRMRQQLAFMGEVRVLGVPAGRGDPGELKPEEVRRWASEQTRSAANA